VKRVVGDLEGNGLLDTITVIHCGVFKDIDTNEVVKFRPHEMDKMISYLNTVDVLIIHNAVGFDIPAMKKVLGYSFPKKVLDTLIMSRVLNPKRTSPINCPYKKAPHSIEAWGYRVGRGKPEHNDWENFSEEMLHRCAEDVEILHLVYNELVKEAEEFGGWFDAPYRPMDMTHKLFSILQQQEDYGWLFDKQHATDCVNHLSDIIDTIAIRLQSKLPLRTIRLEKTVSNDEKYWQPLVRNLHLVRDDGDCFSYVRMPFLKNGKYNAHVTRFIENSGHKPRIVGPHSRIEIRPVDIDSPNELKDLLLSLGWIPAQWNTDADNKRTSPKLDKDDPFEGVEGGMGKMIAKRVQCKHRRSQIMGWFEHIQEDGRIHGRVTGLATTGRAKHGIIVNVPGLETFYGKQMRACFTSKPGYVIVGTDSAGCQNRMLAARVGDEFFTKTLLEGKKSDKTTIHYVNQRAIKEVAGIDVSYHEAKTLNYAALFGASDGKLGRSVGRDASVGALIKKAIFGVAPGFQKLVDSLQEEWRSNAKVKIGKFGRPEFYNGWIKGLDGRPILIESEHAILVYVLQSDEAIMMSAAYCKLYDEATKRFGPFGENWAFLVWYHK
jgi:DNA polymerase III epsilon subunit-like protein